MSIPDDLLELAEHLSRRDTKKPRQANLRRAVSSAYYALFQRLVQEAASILVSDRSLRPIVARAFAHGEMKHAARQFAEGRVPAHLQRCVGSRTVPKDLEYVAKAFVELQEARHDADYNYAESFKRTQVQGYIHRARTALAAWSRIRGRRIATVFLAALLLSQRWNR